MAPPFRPGLQKTFGMTEDVSSNEFNVHLLHLLIVKCPPSRPFCLGFCTLVYSIRKNYVIRELHIFQDRFSAHSFLSKIEIPDFILVSVEKLGVSFDVLIQTSQRQENLERSVEQLRGFRFIDVN